MGQDTASSTLRQAARATSPAKNVPRKGGPDGIKFIGSHDFQVELRRRVDAYFRTSGRRQRDCPRMFLKSAMVIGWFTTSYLLLVFCAEAWWQAVPLAISLGLAMAAVGFNIQHDGSHHAYSERPWINTLAAFTLDLIGVSSFVWHWTHNVVHHTYSNITGHDNDIDLGPLARLSPHQKRRVFHRYQHWYIWLLYSLFTIKWHLFDDFCEVLLGRIGSHRLPRLRIRDRIAFVAGKVISFSLTFGVPLWRHPPAHVFLYYVMVSCVLGFTLSVVFQLAHCVEEADFPLPPGKSGRIETAWAVHQVQTTVNFSPRSRLAAWFLGGLNFQIEHHLLPRVCHVNYPELSSLVEGTCREFGVRYAVHASFRAALTSHYRWLRRMGNPDAI